MNLSMLLGVLARRRGLRRHDHWSREEIASHRAGALNSLRTFAYEHSPFYQHHHNGLFDQPLQSLPVVTKKMMMEHFDEFVTDRSVRLSDLEAYVANLPAERLFLDHYRVSTTSGTTGRRGLFLFDPDEWLWIIGSYARSNEWGGARAGLTRRMKLAVVSSTASWHQSAQVGATVKSWWVPTLRIDATDPIEKTVARLNEWQPDTLVAYASMIRVLATEQLAGRLSISPGAIFSASEVLTDESRRLATSAWGRQPFNVYAATETATIASECERHKGMHLFEDLVITEVVDEHNQPVPPGVYGEKILVTVLFSKTQPLIRYEMSDSIRLANHPCDCGRAFALIDGIQGRVEDILRFPGSGGTTIEIHPNVFHLVFDHVRSAGWQVLQHGDELEVLLSGIDEDFDDAALKRALHDELARQGAVVPVIELRRVEAIPRTIAGKAPLVKADSARS